MTTSRQRSSRRSKSSRNPRYSWIDAALLLLLLAVFLPAMHQAQRIFQADWSVLEARQNIYRWGQGSSPMRVAEWVKARDQTQAALDITPKNPGQHDQMAALYLLRARQSPPGSAFERSMYAQAAVYYRQSLALRPEHGWVWAGLAESLLVAEPNNLAEGWRAWARAHQLAPHEILVQSVLYRTALRGGATAPASVQQWLQATLSSTDKHLRQRLGLPKNAPIE